MLFQQQLEQAGLSVNVVPWSTFFYKFYRFFILFINFTK